MIKQSVVAISLLLLLVFTTTLLETVNCSTTLAAAPFIFNNILLKQKNRQTTTVNGNICCLPQVFSMKGTFTQIFPTRNTTLHSVEGGVEVSADYINGKIYQKVSYNTSPDNQKSLLLNGKNNTVNSIEVWEIRMTETLTISYTVQNGRCTCFKVEPPQNLWQPLCIPPFEKDAMVSKVKIGQYDALKISGEINGIKGQVLTFREPQMNGDKCWVLSNLYGSQATSQEQVFYDMIEKVNSNIFKIPSSCPTVDKCL